MKLNDAIDTKEGVLLRLARADNPGTACKFTFSERNAVTDAFTFLLGDFEDLGSPCKQRPYRYFKEVFFFEDADELPIKVDVVFGKKDAEA